VGDKGWGIRGVWGGEGGERESWGKCWGCGGGAERGGTWRVVCVVSLSLSLSLSISEKERMSKVSRIQLLTFSS